MRRNLNLATQILVTAFLISGFQPTIAEDVYVRFAAEVDVVDSAEGIFSDFIEKGALIEGYYVIHVPWTDQFPDDPVYAKYVFTDPTYGVSLQVGRNNISAFASGGDFPMNLSIANDRTNSSLGPYVDSWTFSNNVELFPVQFNELTCFDYDDLVTLRFWDYDGWMLEDDELTAVPPDLNLCEERSLYVRCHLTWDDYAVFRSHVNSVRPSSETSIELTAAIDHLLIDDLIFEKQASSLKEKLLRADAHFDEGDEKNIRLACNQMEAFLNQMEAFTPRFIPDGEPSEETPITAVVLRELAAQIMEACVPAE